MTFWSVLPSCCAIDCAVCVLSSLASSSSSSSAAFASSSASSSSSSASSASSSHPSLFSSTQSASSSTQADTKVSKDNKDSKDSKGTPKYGDEEDAEGEWDDGAGRDGWEDSDEEGSYFACVAHGEWICVCLYLRFSCGGVVVCGVRGGDPLTCEKRMDRGHKDKTVDF